MKGEKVVKLRDKNKQTWFTFSITILRTEKILLMVMKIEKLFRLSQQLPALTFSKNYHGKKTHLCFDKGPLISIKLPPRYSFVSRVRKLMGINFQKKKKTSEKKKTAPKCFMGFRLLRKL